MQQSFHPATTRESHDRLALRLRHTAELILVMVAGLSPLLFIPTPYISIGAGKVLILLAGLVLALFFFGLSVLRTGALSFRFSAVQIGLWVLAAVTISSAIFSGDYQDSLFGDGFEIQTAIFVTILALLATVIGILKDSKASIIRLYALLIFSALLLSVFHIIRIFFGADTLSFGLFPSATASPLGSWNGLAIFYGLTVLLSLTALQQLPLTAIGRGVIVVVSVVALGMLTLINFSAIWYVLAAVSILLLLYSLVRNRWSVNHDGGKHDDDGSFFSIIVATLVALIAIIFIVGGDRLGTAISNAAGVQFVEVRPSLLATIDLGQQVFADSPFFGAGPNRFADVWRLHKDQSINQTIFWNTNFDTGYSYLATSIIGSGLAGAIAWLFFLGTLLWSGVRFLLKASFADRFWYFTGLSALIASVYLWGISVIYVPPPSILFVAAITTGVFMVAHNRLLVGKERQISIARRRADGFALIVIVIVAITASAGTLYTIGKQASGVYAFNHVNATVSEGDRLANLETGIAGAFEITRNDVFARQLAFYQWLQMRSLLGTAEPTTEQQQAFQDAATKGITAARLAIDLDPTEPANHQLLGQIYGILTVVGVDGAGERAAESYATARSLDPYNPILRLLEAELALSRKDGAGARAAAEEAVKLRPIYTEAMYFLAELDIADGNVEQAAKRAADVVQLEPQNPARRYQLGILLASLQKLDAAVASFEAAVTLDPQYANARYFLALGYAEQGKTDQALKELEVVRGLNESNQSVSEVIDRIKKGEPVSITGQNTVAEREADGENVTASDLENDLVTSPNPVVDKEKKTEVPSGAAPETE